ncbi:adhesion G protein-coupled receptor A3 [Alosa alosa]|uniref:adhesion G protein-coupled receptor A3 n=1 Tax=Alosa alosa TaxID=278164 RepID=UPI0020152217|nr:adhesion G protein-coupled receptor A3 [Alosa alosa]
MMKLITLLCVLLGLWRSVFTNRNCPDLIIDSCHCTSERSKELSRQNVRVKVVCNDADLLDTLQPSFLPNTTVSLILSHNKISLLKNGSFFGLAALEKLDLRNNLISRLEPGAFRGLAALKRLDLSNNRIGCLSPEMFLGLGNLTKLNLSGNIFSTLPDGLFAHLLSLRALHFSTDSVLHCQLGGVRLWARPGPVASGTTSPGVFPTHLQGMEVRSLPPQQLTCDGPLELPLFQLIPSQTQVVFRGDRLPLQCTVSYLEPSLSVTWSHNQQPVLTQEDRGVYVEEPVVHDCCLVTRWPKTLAGIIVTLHCAAPKKTAWRRCDRSGRWAEEDYTQCPYASEVTRALHQLTKMAVNNSNALTLAQQLASFTSRAAHFGDVMDVIFVTHLVERITRLVGRIRELADLVWDIASNMMLVEEHILWMAQTEARACTRIVQCVEHVAELALNSYTPLISKVSPNIALEAFLVKRSNLIGLSCVAVQRSRPAAPPVGPAARDAAELADTLLNFKCQPINTSSSPAGQLSKNTVAVASIHLPLAAAAAAAPSTSALQSVDNSTCKLQFIVFRNGKLFPCTGNSSNLADDGKRRSVATPVAFTKLDGCSLGSAVQPVTIALRHLALGVDPTAAYWDFDLLDGHGGWRAEGCNITGSVGNTTTIYCTHHKNFAVLMDLKKALSLPLYPGEFLHPVVYACTAVMLLCLFASIITYIVHHSAIRISRKGWHMLLNFCFHTALTFAVFAGGINRIKYPMICQAVGVVLHYSSLSTMLWLGVTARNIYKQVTKKPTQPQDGDAPTHQPKSPMLRFYLVSGGIPFIICGITAATNIENYGSGELTPYCWMAWEPSLGAFYGPVAFIALVTCIYFLGTFIQLRRHPERKYELKASSEEHQRLASGDLPPHCHQGPEQGAPPASAEVGRVHCAGGCGVNPALLANEHSFSAQLSTAAFTLFLFLATWTFGALAVTMGHFLDMIFSCLYGAFSVTLGLFVLIHHCAKRDDVWHCWCSCCPGRRGGGPRHGGHGGCSGHGHGHAHGPAHHHHHHHGRLKQLNVNGDSLAHGGPLLHCGHLDTQCPGVVGGKGLLGVHTRAPCKLGGLPSPNPAAATHVGPPCCTGLHSQQLLPDEDADGEDEPTAAHVLLHADPEGYRPAIHLHRCLKGGPGSTGGSVRTKGRRLSRQRVGGGSEREFAFHLPADCGGGSGHSSRANSPHSMLDAGHHHHHHHPGGGGGGHHLCHVGAHEHDLGYDDPHHHHHLHHHHHAAGGCHEGPHHSCHAALCHARHACCAKAELFPALCPPELVGDAGAFLCGCGKMAPAAADEELGMGGHLEMRPRRQSLLQNPSPSQNGILKSSTPENVLYPLDSTGNIRTGPWKNETTV